MKITNLRELEEQGYTIVDNMIEHEFLDAIKASVTAIFDKQIEYTKSKDIKANNDSNKAKHSGTVSRIADSGLRAYIIHTFG